MMNLEWTNLFLNSRVFDMLALIAVSFIGFSAFALAMMVAVFFASGLWIMVEELILYLI